MSIMWGPALDAELAYRAEQTEAPSHGLRLRRTD